MKWFEGDIREAVEKSKSEKAIFVVFIEGRNHVSEVLTQALNSTEVSSRLESEKFVAIKIQSDTITYTFFSSIYKMAPIPSIFFIGENGKPLEIVDNSLSASELVSKIDSILLTTRPQAKSPLSESIDARQKAHSSNYNQDTSKAQDNISTNSIISNEYFKSLPTNNTANSSEPTKKDGIAGIIQEENIERNKEIARAKLLIEMQNKKKAEEEERKEREREIERRKVGKDLQKWKKDYLDRQIKEEYEERMKEEAATVATRDNILRQIAEDNLERKRKFEMSVQERNIKKQNKALEEKAARVQIATLNDITKTRIQFKFPAGNTLIGTFEVTSTLDNLRTYVIQNAELPFRKFSMSAFFPRRDFSSDDNKKTLLELRLIPSSVILILPIKSHNPGSLKKSDDGNIFSFFIWTLLAPVISMYNHIMGYFRGRRGGNSNDNESRNLGNSQIGNVNVDFGQFSNIRNRRSGGQGTAKIKSHGNIHTLHSEDNDNDENNTWNGNSTQQM